MSAGITRDNIHLSRLITSNLGSADDGAPLSILSCSNSKILEFLSGRDSTKYSARYTRAI